MDTLNTDLIQDLISFLDQSPTAFHAAEQIRQRLLANDFQELKETEHWQLNPHGRYFVNRYDSAIIAWKMGEHTDAPGACAIALSHLDSPGLRLKLRNVRTDGNCLIVPVEKYSSNIDTTWLDHPLTVAGRVILQNLEPRLVAFPKPIAVIPNLAIHLQRDVNQGIKLNPQTQLSAILGTATPQDFLQQLADLAHCQPQDIADSDLALVDATPATRVGLNQDLINAPRLDNLLAAHAMCTAMNRDSVQNGKIPLAFFADNEEIGSNTPTGADSAFLRDTIARINLACGGTQEDEYRTLAASALISVDAAHAFHPNYPEKYDPHTSPYVNQGIALKSNPNGRYITNPKTATWFRKLCHDAGASVQPFAVRADMPCGSTVGPTTAARLGIQGVDVGNPIWAMHSVRETAGIMDQIHMTNMLRHYFHRG